MNREQAINYLISSGFTHEQVGEVVRALTYEPTTKNDLGVDCISREQALVAIRNLYPGMPRVDFSGSLRKWVDKYKPYIECDDAIKQLPSVTPQPTKNDLGVDLISRADAIRAMQDKAKKLTNEDTINGLCGAVAILFDLPSVTPQEPFINKPCVSSGVCEHDKNKVLDKLRAEIENDWQLKKYPSSPFSCGLRRAIEIIDKYKAKTEVKDESTN